ncbi:hypothetical protein N658DRAFT_498245 [Parathielavia hyrcaniae]|uniref:Uncharacterized protein n=1 Tax=Parathielavia hyrcaniae TaxID=113614 RepID=A0AAN6Q221_9PEZI|nr:hypothetical protein N658DRAFT_498245 [Parathielavia hyrcaniae]
MAVLKERSSAEDSPYVIFPSSRFPASLLTSPRPPLLPSSNDSPVPVPTPDPTLAPTTPMETPTPESDETTLIDPPAPSSSSSRGPLFISSPLAASTTTSPQTRPSILSFATHALPANSSSTSLLAPPETATGAGAGTSTNKVPAQYGDERRDNYINTSDRITIGSLVFAFLFLIVSGGCWWWCVRRDKRKARLARARRAAKGKGPEMRAAVPASARVAGLDVNSAGGGDVIGPGAVGLAELGEQSQSQRENGLGNVDYGTGRYEAYELMDVAEGSGGRGNGEETRYRGVTPVVSPVAPPLARYRQHEIRVCSPGWHGA